VRLFLPRISRINTNQKITELSISVHRRKSAAKGFEPLSVSALHLIEKSGPNFFEPDKFSYSFAGVTGCSE
jgi:hypothetical protein